MENAGRRYLRLWARVGSASIDNGCRAAEENKNCVTSCDA